MIELGPHAAFIIWSYAGVAILLAAMIGYVLWNARRVREQHKALEARGIRRRSDSAAAGG
jgi:heme exporter protein D